MSALRELSVDEVAGRLGTPNFFVYDNNREARFKAGHVPGARFADPGQMTASDLPADKGATLVFYCSGPG